MDEPKFEAGDRVRLSDRGKQNARKRERRGVVIGISRTGTQVRVQWDDLRLPYMLHWTYIERDDGSCGS